MENISIKEVPISIKIIEINNKKMTISVFNQIPSYSEFEFRKILDGDLSKSFLGWVFREKDREKSILFIHNNSLCKVSYFIPLFESSLSNIENASNSQLISNYILDNNNQIYIAT